MQPVITTLHRDFLIRVTLDLRPANAAATMHIALDAAVPMQALSGLHGCEWYQEDISERSRSLDPPLDMYLEVDPTRVTQLSTSDFLVYDPVFPRRSPFSRNAGGATTARRIVLK